MAFNINIPQGKSNEKPINDYDNDCRSAERARNNQKRDTDPGMEKEGYLDVSNLDKMRRNKIYTR